MGASVLERELVHACPSFRDVWASLRASYAGEPPSAKDFLGALRSHVLMLVADGRSAEVTRLCYALERLLGEADPILEKLLVDEFVKPLAGGCAGDPASAAALVPHLGPRTRRAWDQAAAR